MHPSIGINDYRYNVRNYGATGNGVTDDTAAIQRAIDAAGRGTVFIPEGTYLVTQLDITTSTNILGCGAGAITPGTGGTILHSHSALPVINISFVDEYLQSFQNFVIIGNLTNNQYGFLINGMSSGILIKNVYVLQCDVGILMGTVRHTTGVNIENSCFQQNVTAGIKGINNPGAARQLNAININNNMIIQNGHGIHIMGSLINIIGNTIQNQTKTGIFLSSRILGEVDSQSQNINIENNYMEENVEASIIGEVYYNAVGPVTQTIMYLTIQNNYVYQTDAVTTENADIIFRRAAGSANFNGLLYSQILRNNLRTSGALYRIDANDCLNNTCTLLVDNCETVDFLTLYAGLWETTFQRPEIIGRINCPGYKNIGHIPVTGITAAQLAPVMAIQQTAAIDITSNPQIAAGQHGQEISIIGYSDVNTLTLDDGNGLKLAGGVSMVLGQDDIIRLKYSITNAVWFEISRSDN